MHAQAATPSSFMPYGAPELKAAQRSFMIRAVATGSAAWIGIFFLLVAYAVFVPHAKTIEAPTTTVVLEPPPPPPIIVKTGVTPPRATIAKPDAGLLEPTVEEVKPAEVHDSPGTGPVSDTSHVAAQPDISSVVPRSAPVTADTVMQSFEVDQLPDALSRISPEYSQMAIDLRIEGTVMVQVLVGKDGRVHEARVAPGFSIPLLDGGALDAAKRWVFTPALWNHRPVAVWVAIPMKFTLSK